MSLFAAAAKKRIMEITGAVGMTSSVSSAGFLQKLLDRFTPRGVDRALNYVGTVGSIVMDAGGAVIDWGWRLTTWGFAIWAGMRLLRGFGRFLGIIGNEILRGLPQTIESAA